MRKTTITLLLAASILGGTATAAQAGSAWKRTTTVTAGHDWTRSVVTAPDAGNQWTAPELGRKLT